MGYRYFDTLRTELGPDVDTWILLLKVWQNVLMLTVFIMTTTSNSKPRFSKATGYVENTIFWFDFITRIRDMIEILQKLSRLQDVLSRRVHQILMSFCGNLNINFG